MNLNQTELAMLVDCAMCQARRGSPCRHLTAHPMGFRPPLKRPHRERIEAGQRLRARAEHDDHG